MRKFILLSRRFARNRPWATSMTGFKMDCRPITDGQVVTNNIKKKATTENLLANRFAKPISEVQIQAKMGDAVPKSTISDKEKRTGDSKEMRKSVILKVIQM